MNWMNGFIIVYITKITYKSERLYRAEFNSSFLSFFIP